MRNQLRVWIASGLVFIVGCAVSAPTSNVPVGYAGKPFEGRAQAIPGKVMCAYYDLGGEGVAYHDMTVKNLGSGTLNPADGTSLNEFRMNEAVDISYTKYRGEIDKNPFNVVQPSDGLLYVGWTEPGEWFNLSVDVAEAGVYTVDIFYTSNRGGEISFDLNGKAVTGPVKIQSTFNPAEPVTWRQWHHWNLFKDAMEVTLPKGRSVVTVHIVSQGNMNLATMEFRRKE